MPDEVRSDEKRIAGRGQKSSDSERARLMPAAKKRILASAAKLFAQKGFDGVGIREICKDAGVNICMISYFWGTKQALYQNIIDNLIQKQTEIAKTFINFNIDPYNMSKKEQIELLYLTAEKLIEFAYGKNLPSSLIKFLISEHHEKRAKINSPFLNYFRKLVGAVFNKDVSDPDIIYKSLFIISQMNAAKVMPLFSLELLNKKSFDEDDISRIKSNLQIYIKSLLLEENINV